MNVLLLTSHAIAEHDDLEMFTRMGVDCYSIGGAYDTVPFEGKRPPVPNVKRFPHLEAATQRQRERLTELYGDPGPNIDWGKAQIAAEVRYWADTIIVHHFPEQWIGGQWERFREKRVIWRTCGQSDPGLEARMLPYRAKGLQIVRYSPKEHEAFRRWGAFAGEDAMIRFGKDPDEWSGWTGEYDAVGNITQNMAQRGDSCGYSFWEAATEGLPTRPAGPGSEELRGGMGQLTYEEMRRYLQELRVYLYTGTRPASYTLGFIEAMMTGVPILSIGKPDFGGAGPLLETDEIVSWADGKGAQAYLRMALDRDTKDQSERTRARAIELFGLDKISAEWASFLGIAA